MAGRDALGRRGVGDRGRRAGAPPALPLGVLQGAGGRRAQGTPAAARPAGARLLKSMPAAKREFIFKDLRLFFRDNTQWSQLILLAVLLLIYIFNIKSLPIHSGERIPFSLVIVISFLNLGLAGFVLAAVAARFIFPAVSLEGRQMWLLRSSPLDPGAMLWSKYWIGTVPAAAARPGDHGADQLAAPGRPVHDGGERRHHPAVHPGGQRAGAHLRRLLPPVRDRERRADPHQFRRGGLHDGEPEPARAGDHARGAARGGAASRLSSRGRGRAHTAACSSREGRSW